MTPVQKPADPVGALLTPDMDAWPPQIRGVRSMPHALFVRGAADALSRRLVAVVGTRRPSGRGNDAAYLIAVALAARGIGIVSGLAFGVDTIAHHTALEFGTATVAVLAHGLDTVYPLTRARLARRIVDKGHALVSEYVDGVEVSPQRLMLRNRITSALSCGVVVVETSPTGGAMHCARFALAQKRPVVVLRPDDPSGLDVTGADLLLTMGAVRAQSFADVAAALGLATEGER